MQQYVVILASFFIYIMSIQKFLDYLEFEKRYSIHTKDAYKRDLLQFFEYIQQNNNITENDNEQITHHIVRNWLSYLIEKKINTRSINRKISTLKAYFNFLKKGEEITLNPMQKIISHKMSKKITPYVEEESLNEMLDEEETKIGYTENRNYLILEVLYETGIRLTELINLKLQDIDIHNLTIKVLGKRNKERIIPITKILKDKIILYLEYKENEEVKNMEKENYLFLTKKGKKIYPKFVYRIVFYYLSRITTNKKKSPHVLRHTFATHMLNHGADLNAIKEILGHTSLNATQVYAHNSLNKLKTIYKQAHPRA